VTDPDDLIGERPAGLGQLLVSAAQDEEPPAALLERTLDSVGLSSTAATVATSTTSTAAAGVLGASAKYAGLAALGVLATGLALGATGTLPRSQPPAESVATRSSGAALVGSIQVPAPAVVTDPQRNRPAALPPGARADAPSAVSAGDMARQPDSALDPAAPADNRGVDHDHGSSRAFDGVPLLDAPGSLLREEAAVIDEAREAVATGNAARALRALEAHGRRFARPLFQPEALYLKMQALRLQGDEPGARAVAQQLLAAYPNGTQASAARALLSGAAAGGPSRAVDKK
jgi:hypothetical protein